MRQKYFISRNLERKELRIMEYAVLNKDLNKRELYGLSENGDRELFFDDMDLIPAE